MTGAGRGFCAGADMEETFKERIDGRDPGGDTAHGQGGMPAGLDWVDALPPLEAARRGGERRRGRHRHDDDPALRRDRRLGEGPLRHALHQGRAGAGAGEHALPGGSASGFGRASEMCLSGRLYPAAEAAPCGLVDRLVAPDDAARHRVRARARDRRQPGPAAAHDQGAARRATAATTDLTAAQQRETRDAARVLEERRSTRRRCRPSSRSGRRSSAEQRPGQQAGAVAKQPTYWLTRYLILRLLGLVYFFAFLSLARQVLPLIGEHGSTPIAPVPRRTSSSIAALAGRRSSTTRASSGSMLRTRCSSVSPGSAAPSRFRSCSATRTRSCSRSCGRSTCRSSTSARSGTATDGRSSSSRRASWRSSSARPSTRADSRAAPRRPSSSGCFAG